MNGRAEGTPDRIELVVGRVLASVLAELLNQAVEGGPKLLRVSSFREGEVAEMAQELMGVDGQDGPVIKVAAANRAGPIPAEAMLDEGETLTKYRNDSDERGAVLVEIDEPADSQGLSSIHHETDRSILGAYAPTSDRVQLLTRHAWAVAKECSFSESAPPATLIDRIERLSRAIPGSGSLRSWTTFLLAVSDRLVALGPVSPADVERSIGQCLVHLRRFPDPELFEGPSGLAARLKRNENLAQQRTPTGNNEDEQDLRLKIERASFVSDNGEPLSDADNATVRRLMLAVIESGSSDARSSTPYRHWNRLYERKRTGGLGDDIADALAENDKLLQAFARLDVQGGLNERESAAAETFVEAGSPEGDSLLLAHLPAPLRRRVQQLALVPRSADDDPLRAILRAFSAANDRAVDGQTTSLGLTMDTPMTDGELPWSLNLFRLIYGRVLSAVAEVSQSNLKGFTLSVDERLIAAPIPLSQALRLESSEESRKRLTQPLQFALWIGEDDRPAERFEWDGVKVPGLVALQRLIDAEAEGARPRFPIEMPDFATWCKQAYEDVDFVLSDELSELASQELDELLDQRAVHFPAWRSKGLDPDDVLEYVSAWTRFIDKARLEMVPRGAPHPAMNALLDFDTARAGESTFVLASHPLRLRWLASHLGEMRRRLTASLALEFRLNSENDSLFYDWLEALSPQDHPPIICDGREDLCVPTREFGLHGEYRAIATGDPGSGQLTVDPASVKEIGVVLRRHLDSFPHKIDGLSVLVASPDGTPDLVVGLYEELIAKHPDLVAEFVVLAPASSHPSLARAFSEQLAAESGQRELARDTRLLPAIRPTLREFEGFEGRELEIDEYCDVAVVPNLFGARVNPIENNYTDARHEGGEFSPWLDSTKHQEVQASATNVARRLLPELPDPAIECWSTLTTRRHRNAPLGADSDISFVTLQVQFHGNLPMFRALHHVSQWVVTLDPFIGRDQIDAIDSPPEIILVRSGVGQSGSHTLVVSSTSGADYVTRALERKLEALELDFGLPVDLRRLAGRLYEVGRHVVPGVMLRALGLGRTTEEIFGLTISRFAVEELQPEQPGDGATWWISLDDRTDWFGGTRSLRADLVRVDAELAEDGALSLRFTVIESKFRQGVDLGSADQQVDRTVELLSQAFGPAEDEAVPSDAAFWHRELLSAIDEVSKQIPNAGDLPARQVRGELDDAGLREIRQRILNGEYEFEIDSVIACVAVGEDGKGSVGETDAGNRLVTLLREDIKRILGVLTEGRAPKASGVIKTIRPRPEEGLGDDDSDGSKQPKRLGDDLGTGDDAGAEAVAPDPARGARPGDESKGTESVLERGLGMDELEARYQTTLDLFDAHGVRVDRPRGEYVVEGPAFYVMRVSPATGVGVDRLTGKLAELKLGLGLSVDQDVRPYVDRGAVHLEVPKDPSDRYDVPTEQLWKKVDWPAGALYAPIGEDMRGSPVGIDFSSSVSPHLLIAGTTGSGKSVALETILAGMVQHYPPDVLELLLVDPKGTELVSFDGDPHVQGAAGRSAEDAMSVLDDSIAVMERRYDHLRAAKCKDLPELNARSESSPVPWRIVVLDEYADLTAHKDDRAEIEERLKRLAQLGRSAGIHLIVTTQRPTADVISTTIRSNLPAQLALRVRSGTDSRVILDELGAETLAGAGDALFKTAERVVRIQCAIVDG